MTLIHMRFSRPGADGTLSPAVGSLKWTPTRRHNSGSTVVLPFPFTVTAQPGPFTVTVEPSGLDWVWKVEENFTGLPKRVVYLAVPNVSERDYTALVQVDRLTLAPSAAPEPAWWAALDAGLQSATPGPPGHNPITVSTAAPTSPVDGDIWFDIS